MENFGTVASYENIREEVASILRDCDLQETTNVESTEYFFDVFVENNRQDEIAFQSSLQDKAIERRESFAQRQPKYENEAHSKGILFYLQFSDFFLPKKLLHQKITLAQEKGLEKEHISWI